MVVTGEVSLSAFPTLNPLTHTAGCFDLEPCCRRRATCYLLRAGEIRAQHSPPCLLDTVHTCIEAWAPLARDKRSRNSTHLSRYTISCKLLPRSATSPINGLTCCLQSTRSQFPHLSLIVRQTSEVYEELDNCRVGLNRMQASAAVSQTPHRDRSGLKTCPQVTQETENE